MGDSRPSGDHLSRFNNYWDTSIDRLYDLIYKEEMMLVLSRKCEESIHISDNIVVTVLDIRGSKVRLGIVAPREIPVRRTELQNHISDPTRHDFCSEANLRVLDISPCIQAWETEGGADK
jgi:carbon storage regulator